MPAFWPRPLRSWLRSPIFIAIVVGLLWGCLALPTGGNPLDMLFGTCKQLEGGLVPLVGLAVGLMLRPQLFVRLAPPAAR